MSTGRLKVAFLIGKSNANTREAVARICQLPQVETAVVLVDTGRDSLSRRWHNLKRNIRREGLSYIGFRLLSAIRQKMEGLADKVISGQEVDRLLEKAFPERNWNQLAEHHNFRIIEAGNLNEDTAVEALRSADADLGIVLGTRILKRRIFAIPRLGCINLHKGHVPDYRGLPPGFWELYDGQPSAGITVHFVDDGLDTGDVVGTAEIAIHAKETPESLYKKLDIEGIRVLAEAVEQIQLGSVIRQPQSPSTQTPRSRPTRVQVEELSRRLPHWRRLPDGRQTIKIAIWLMLFYGGVFSFLRWIRRRDNRAAILLYHRVNDISDDVLTVNTRRFAQHLVTICRFYHPMASEEIIDRLVGRSPLPPTSVAVHFDDCYRDVRTCAAPLLAAAGVPATAFVSSGFVDSTRAFRHDEDRYPHRFENFSSADLHQLPDLGVSVAAHTVNHVDLGSVSLEQAQVEVIESGRELERIMDRPVLFFSFPFGKIHNIREEVRAIVKTAGYRALFSAYGGFLHENTSLLDVPRFGVSSDHSPLALLMELEGISLGYFKRWLLRSSSPESPAPR